MKFRNICVQGTHEEIGLQYGKRLKNEIHKNIKFYIPYIKSILKLHYPASVHKFKKQVKEYFPHLYVEIEHIARGAEVEIEDLIAMNSRTELLLGSGNECTAIGLPGDGILAQNWDWTSRLEDTTVIVEMVYPDNHKILMLTEAGIVGKIGLNNHNIGVTLNILRTEEMELNGPPVHLIMRSVLEQKTLDDAMSHIKAFGAGTSSNLIVSDGYKAFDVEYAGSQFVINEILQPAYTHTNHFMHHCGVFIDIEDYADSAVRYNTVTSKLKQSAVLSEKEIKNILSDQSDNNYNVLADYEPYLDEHMGLAGTLATIVMNLREGVMEVRKGNPSMVKFEMDGFEKYAIC